MFDIFPPVCSEVVAVVWWGKKVDPEVCLDQEGRSV